MGQTMPLFIYLFSFFPMTNKNDNSVDDVLGTRTRIGRMVGTDESTELWLHHYSRNLPFQFKKVSNTGDQM